MSAKGTTELTKAERAFIWVRQSASATGFKYLGAQANYAALLYSKDLDSKMSTGRETFNTDLPEIRLAPICLITNLRLSFWPSIKS